MQHFGRPWNTFLHLILICRADFVPLHPNLSKMVTELLVVWIVGVVAFFVLWAILAKIIKRISDKKNKTENVIQKEASEKDISDEHSL